MHLYKCMSPINRNECHVAKCATDLPRETYPVSFSLARLIYLEESISTNNENMIMISSKDFSDDKRS